MKPFTFRNPTKLIFGKGQIEQLRQEVTRYGKKVLLVYGGGSIKRNGLYDEVMAILAALAPTLLSCRASNRIPASRPSGKGLIFAGRKGLSFCSLSAAAA